MAIKFLNTVQANTVNIGAGVELKESPHRADLLQITSATSTWAGIQLRNSSNEGRWSLMTDGSLFGIYDDENDEWGLLINENQAVSLRYNNTTRLETKNDGARTWGNHVATGGFLVPYAGGQKKPMINLEGATNYGLWHTEGSNDIFSFDFGGVSKHQFFQTGNAVFAGQVQAASLDINGVGDFSGKVDFQGTAAIEGGSGYGVFKGYTTNDNHFIAVRGIVANTSTLSITGGHQTTFVEHADSTSEGWYFKSKTTGAYREIARIDGTNQMFLGGNKVWNAGNDGAGSGLDADLLDGKDHTNFGATLATYGTTAGASGRIRCTAPFNTNSGHMFQVTVSIYSSYTVHNYVVSGYMYSSTNNWYVPKVVYSGTGTPDIKVGRDSNGKAYISIANGAYTGVRVHNMTQGYYTSVADTYDPWTITIDAALPNVISPDIYTTWTSGNDGAGSGLDADLLDGQQGSYYAAASSLGNYLPVNNPTFTGTLTGPKLSIQNQINTTSANLEINYENGDGTTTNFKDLYIRDGKNSTIASFNGSSKSTTLQGNLSVGGNSFLGNSNGDYVHVNDKLFVGATDSGNAEFWFGEGTTGDVNYGARWYWDSGYTHNWYTVNNSSETLMMSYATNDTSKVNWYRDIDIQDNDILIDSSHGFVNSGAWTRNSTPHGYIDFGPANTSHAHIYTDRPNFYFNK